MSAPKNLMDALRFMNTTPERLQGVLSIMETFQKDPGACLCHGASIGDINSIKIMLARVSPDTCGIESPLSTPLMKAAYYGHTEAVKLLLSRGAQPNLKSSAGWTALHYALKPIATDGPYLQILSDTDLKKSKEIALLLLKNKADPNIIGTEESVHPLKLAAEFGDLEMVQLLVKYGAKEITDDNHLNGASHIALMKKKPDILKYFVTQPEFSIDAKLRTVPAEEGISLLHLAVLKEEMAVAEILIKQGADPNDIPLGLVISRGDLPMFKILCVSKKFNVKRLTGETFPANAAAQMGRIAMLKFLVQAGALQNEVDEKGNTALMCAARNGKMECVEFLLANRADVNKNTKLGNALQAAVVGGHIEIAARLLKAKADVNAVVKREKISDDRKIYWYHTALGIAVESQNIPMTVLLLQAGAAVDIPVYESEGECLGNVFDLAVHSKNIALMKTLLNSQQAREVEAEKLAKMKISALKIAVAVNHLEYFDMLAEGVNLNLLVEDEFSILLMACRFGNTDAVRKLLIRKVNVTQVSREGYTPLMSATLRGHAEIVGLLLEAGAFAHINDQDSRGETALMRACSKGHLDCAELLLSAGASVDIKDQEGDTALHWAAFHNQSAIIQLLARRTKLDLEARNNAGNTAIEVTTDPKTIQQLRSLGAKAEAMRVRAELCFYLTFLNDVDRIRELLEMVNVNQGFNPEETSPPFFILSNFRNLDIRVLVLKNKLYHDYPEIIRSKIDKFADLLLKTCKVFFFATDGSLCISIIIKKVAYELTLSKAGIQAFLVEKEISEPGFAKLLQQRSEEGRALEEERKLKNLKEDALAQLLTEIRKVQKDWEVLDGLALLAKQHLGSDKETTLLRKNCKVQLERIVTERKKLKEDLASNEEARIKVAIQRIRDLGTLQEENITKKLSILKSTIANIAAGIPGIQSQSTARDKREKKKQQKTKKKGQAAKQGHGILDKNQIQKLKNEGIDDKKIVNETLVQSRSEVSETEKQAKNIAAELEREQEQVALRTDVKPLGTPKILTESELPQLSSKYFEQSDSIMAHDPLRPRHHTLGRASDVLGVLNRHHAKEGRATLSETVANLSDLSLGAHPPERGDKQGDKPGNKSGDKPALNAMELLIDINSSKGALAQAFETRRGLKEEWPARIRTILFKNEDGVRKILDESQVDERSFIKIVCDICEKMTKISEENLRKNQGKLSLKDIDVPLKIAVSDQTVPGILESLHAIDIPPFEIKRADEMIKKSLDELAGFEKYIQEHREQGKAEELTQNPNFYMAVGWSLQRLCTYWKEIQDNEASARSKYAAHLSKSRYGKYLPTFGQCYRHHDQAWKPAVRNFVQDCLRVPMMKKDAILKMKDEVKNLRQGSGGGVGAAAGYTPAYSVRISDSISDALRISQVPSMSIPKTV